MDDQWHRRIAAANEKLAASGMRVLGVAFRPLDVCQVGNVPSDAAAAMTSNAGEIWVMVLGPLLGMPLPLLPLQILWINLVTDGLPGLALARTVVFWAVEAQKWLSRWWRAADV